jgi:hypothetical protein
MSTFQVPASLDDAVEQLEAIGRIVTAREWERAAILATYVMPDSGHGGRTQTGSSAHLVSAREFAERGIHGLRSHHTVLRYVNAWLDKRSRPRPGQTVSLRGLGPWPPDLEAPGRNIADGSRREALVKEAEAAGTGASKVIDIASNPKALAAAITADEKTAAAAAEALINRELRSSGHRPMQPQRTVPDPRPDVVQYLDTMRSAWIAYRSAYLELVDTDPQAAAAVDAQFRELLIAINVWASPVPNDLEGIDS